MRPNVTLRKLAPVILVLIVIVVVAAVAKNAADDRVRQDICARSGAFPGAEMNGCVERLKKQGQ